MNRDTQASKGDSGFFRSKVTTILESKDSLSGISDSPSTNNLIDYFNSYRLGHDREALTPPKTPLDCPSSRQADEQCESVEGVVATDEHHGLGLRQTRLVPCLYFKDNGYLVYRPSDCPDQNTYFVCHDQRLEGESADGNACITLQPLMTFENLSYSDSQSASYSDINKLNPDSLADRTTSEPEAANALGSTACVPCVPSCDTHSFKYSDSQFEIFSTSVGSSGSSKTTQKMPPLAIPDRSYDFGVSRQEPLSTSDVTSKSRRFSNEPRTCSICGRSFKYPSDLKKHEATHTDNKKFVCQVCGRTFRRLHQLNVHKRIHTGEKPYVCSKCGMSFRHDSTLTMHTRTRHEHLKPFKCVACDKMFGRLSHLRKHQKYVCSSSLKQSHDVGDIVEERIWQCNPCGFTLPSEARLRDHLRVCPMRVVNSEFEELVELSQPHYLCDNTSLISGISQTNGHGSKDSGYCCNYCYKQFFRLSDLQKHLASHLQCQQHGVVDNSAEMSLILKDQEGVCCTTDERPASLGQTHEHLRYSELHEHGMFYMGYHNQAESYLCDITVAPTSLELDELASKFLAPPLSDDQTADNKSRAPPLVAESHQFVDPSRLLPEAKNQ